MLTTGTPCSPVISPSPFIEARGEAWHSPGSTEVASGLSLCGQARAAPRAGSLPLALTPCSLSPEWFASSTQSYILRDLDDTSVMEDGRKKLNTLAHYKVGSPAPPNPIPSLPNLTSDISFSPPIRSLKVPPWP